MVGWFGARAVTAPLCILVKGFPRISETFITREIETLQDAGLRFSLASLRRAQTEAKHVSHRVHTQINYLPEYLHEEPVRVSRALNTARRMPGAATAWRMFRADVKRDFSRNRLRRFGQACVLAAELPAETRHLHAHFIHTPASVARYAAALRGISFSVSAHAKDIWTTPDWDLRDKLDRAEFVCTCNAAGAARLSALAPGWQVHLWPHLTIQSLRTARVPRTGPVRLLTVARAVPKKGLRLLLTALAQLRPEPAWTWTHIGGGPELAALKAAVQNHPYKERVTIMGALPHEDVVAALGRHDIFVLTAQVSDDGDRDGRPNALIEAMNAGLACIATGVGGIPEVLTSGSGTIVAPEPAAIAGAIQTLVSAPETILSLGDAARARALALQDEGREGFSELERALRRVSSQ